MGQGDIWRSRWRCRQTKEKLAANRHSADVGRRVRVELKRIEAHLIDAGLMPEYD